MHKSACKQGSGITDADSHRNYIASLNDLTPVPVPAQVFNPTTGHVTPHGCTAATAGMPTQILGPSSPLTSMHSILLALQ